jgi:hypothetical protein
VTWRWMTKLNISASEFIYKQKVLGRPYRLLSLIRHGPHRKRRIQQFFYCCVCIRYHGNVFTEPLPRMIGGFLWSHCLATIEGCTYRHTDWCQGFFTYAIEMGSGATTYAPSFVKISSGTQKLMRGDTQTHTHRQQGDLISLFIS